MKHYTKETLQVIIPQSNGYAEVLRKCNLKPAGGNYAQLKKYIQLWNIDISHFKGNAWNKGLHTTCNPAKPLVQYLSEDSHYPSDKLRKRLLKENVFTAQCSNCKNTEWENLPIPLELDHINGIKTDNRLINLRLLCPNCHAQTPTYRGKNIRKR